MTQIKVLALDLEGTLISNAISQFPRPGLSHFLEQVHKLFSRVVMYTAVHEDRLREVADLLVYVKTGQEQQSVHIETYGFPYSQDDDALACVLEILEPWSRL